MNLSVNTALFLSICFFQIWSTFATKDTPIPSYSLNYEYIFQEGENKILNNNQIPDNQQLLLKKIKQYKKFFKTELQGCSKEMAELKEAAIESLKEMTLNRPIENDDYFKEIANQTSQVIKNQLKQHFETVQKYFEMVTNIAQKEVQTALETKTNLDVPLHELIHPSFSKLCEGSFEHNEVFKNYSLLKGKLENKTGPNASNIPLELEQSHLGQLLQPFIEDIRKDADSEIKEFLRWNRKIRKMDCTELDTIQI